MRTPTIPRLYMGTMTFAWNQASSVVDQPVALEMVQRFMKCNQQLGVTDHYVDTARIYAGGQTEPVVGAVLSKLGSTVPGAVLVGTKAHPSQQGGLSAQGIQSQLKESMAAMQIDSVQEYYLHQPDTENSLLESLECLHELIQEGVISAIGMSNYHASEVASAFTLCRQHNLTPPSVYQGLYNPLNRAVEDELLPVLRENKCSFVAYNPLAAGLLAGKHTDLQQVQKGRFQNNPNYLPRFYTEANFQAVAIIRAACDKQGISMVEAVYRWMLRHSALSATTKDGLLLGASSVSQLDQNLEACIAANEKEDLSAEMLQAFEEAWELARDGAFPYWRSYSSDMPNRESLDQGASYNAAKKKTK